MSTINNSGALELAKTYSEASDAVHKQLLQLLASGGAANEIAALRSQRDSLLIQSTDIVTHAVGMALDAAGGDLKQLLEAVKSARDAINKVKMVKQAITLAGDLITLGAAIVAKNPGDAATAIGDIVKDIQEINKASANK